MALKPLKNGQYKITTRAQAKEALQLMLEKEQAVSELEEKHGIKEMKQDAVELKKAATAYMDEKDITALEFPGKVAKLIRGVDEIWINTREDLRRIPAAAGARTLRSILSREMWMQITKRVVDPEKLDDAVARGDISEDEISDALYEKPRAAYVRVFDD